MKKIRKVIEAKEEWFGSVQSTWVCKLECGHTEQRSGYSYRKHAKKPAPKRVECRECAKGDGE